MAEELSAIPALLLSLMDRPGSARAQAELALLQHTAESVRSHLIPGLIVPSDVSAELAVHVLGGQPERLLRWALAAGEESFREVVQRFPTNAEMIAEPAAGERERAFVLAVSDRAPSLAELNVGLASSDPLVVWCYERAASRLPPEIRSQVSVPMEKPFPRPSSAQAWVRETEARLGTPGRPPKNKLLSMRYGSLDATPELITKRNLTSSKYEPPWLHTYESHTHPVQPGGWECLEELLARLGLPGLWRADSGYYDRRNALNRNAYVIQFSFSWGERSWSISTGSSPPGGDLVGRMLDLISGGLTGPNEDVERLYEQADTIRRYHSRHLSLEERLRYLLTDSAKFDDEGLRGCGPEAADELLRLHFEGGLPRERVERALHEVLGTYPQAELDPRWVIASLGGNFNLLYAGVAVRAGKRDERVAEKLRQLCSDGRELDVWEMEALGELDPEALGAYLRPHWRGPNTYHVMRLARPHDLELMGQDMLQALEQADEGLQKRAVAGLAWCHPIAAQARAAISAAALAHPALSSEALVSLKKLPPGRESEPFLMSHLRGDKTSLWPLELLIAGGAEGAAFEEQLVECLSVKGELGALARQHLEHLRLHHSQRIYSSLSRGFRPSRAAIQLATDFRPQSLELLGEALGHFDPEVRTDAATSLQSWIDQEPTAVLQAAQVLDQALGKESRSSVRCALACSLGHLDPSRTPQLCTWLGPMLSDEDSWARYQAAAVFASWGALSAPALPFIESQMLQARAPEIRRDLGIALEAIRRLGPGAFPPEAT